MLRKYQISPNYMSKWRGLMAVEEVVICQQEI